jgi:hypothetical protein
MMKNKIMKIMKVIKVMKVNLEKKIIQMGKLVYKKLFKVKEKWIMFLTKKFFLVLFL